MPIFRDPNARADSPDKVFDQPVSVMIAGQEFKFSRLTCDDIAASYGRIRDARIRAVMRNSGVMVQHTAAQAIAYAACVDPTQEDFWNYVSTPVGAVYIIWRSLVKNHPTLTEVDVSRLVEEESSLLEVIFHESGLTRPEEEKDTGGEDSLPFPPTFEGNREQENSGSKEPS